MVVNYLFLTMTEMFDFGEEAAGTFVTEPWAVGIERAQTGGAWLNQ